MSTHDDGYRTTSQPGGGLFDDSGYTAGSAQEQTSLIAPVEDAGEGKPDANRWHGGLDLGLLVLRLVLGGTMGAHGLQKLFGSFGGPGIDGFADVLEQFGYTSQTTLLSWITALSETVGGLLLVFGLFTPIGAAAILGVTANIVYLKFSGGFFVGQGTGFEYELLLAAAAFTLLFTGPGRVAVDKNTPWRRKPLPFALIGLLLAAAGTVAVLVLAR